MTVDYFKAYSYLGQLVANVKTWDGNYSLKVVLYKMNPGDSSACWKLNKQTVAEKHERGETSTAW